jgi:hypothetical protein
MITAFKRTRFFRKKLFTKQSGIAVENVLKGIGALVDLIEFLAILNY